MVKQFRVCREGPSCAKREGHWIGLDWIEFYLDRIGLKWIVLRHSRGRHTGAGALPGVRLNCAVAKSDAALEPLGS